MSRKTAMILILALMPAAAMFAADGDDNGLSSYFETYFADKVKTFELENGMTFLLVNRPEVPVFSAVVSVKAGSVDEPRGKTGVAHVFEHMAFKGTTSIGSTDYTAEKEILARIEDIGLRLTKARQRESSAPDQIKQLENDLKTVQDEHEKYIKDNEFSQIYNHHGANFVNAGTAADLTLYMVNLPSNQLELWARMETDRLLQPVFRQFYKERDVIMEERRMGVDNDPMGHLREEFTAAAFAAHPYGDPVIGYMSDIAGLTIADARAFHKKYYVPNNIVVSVVGDVTVEKLKPVAEKYFGLLPRKPDPERNIPEEPLQQAERRVYIHRDAEPQLLMGWHIPRYPTAGAAAMRILADVLGSGRTSRLYKRLVLEENIATRVSVFDMSISRYPQLLSISVAPRDETEYDRIIEIIDEEIQSLIDHPPTQAEIDKVKKSFVADFIRGLESNFVFALQLSYFHHMLGSSQMLGQFVADIQKLEPADISQVTGKYLGSLNRTIGFLVPKESHETDEISEEEKIMREKMHRMKENHSHGMGGSQ